MESGHLEILHLPTSSLQFLNGPLVTGSILVTLVAVHRESISAVFTSARNTIQKLRGESQHFANLWGPGGGGQWDSGMVGRRVGTR